MGARIFRNFFIRVQFYHASKLFFLRSAFTCFNRIGFFGSSDFTGQISFPLADKIDQNGKCIKSLHGDTITFTMDEPGVYRVEAYKQYLGRRQGWVFSNPIYIR